MRTALEITGAGSIAERRAGGPRARAEAHMRTASVIPTTFPAAEGDRAPAMRRHS
jgi:hypothetical protein